MDWLALVRLHQKRVNVRLMYPFAHRKVDAPAALASERVVRLPLQEARHPLGR